MTTDKSPRFTGYAHCDGDIEHADGPASGEHRRRPQDEHSYMCPRCKSNLVYATGSTESDVLSCHCCNCDNEWRAENRLKTLPLSPRPDRVAEKERRSAEVMNAAFSNNPFPGTDRVADFPQVVKDRTKARFDLIPYGPLWKMAEVMTNGANKPGRVAHNWRKGTDWSDYYGALMRHAALWQQGEDFEIDPDTGTRIDHLAAVMCCAAILLEYQMFSIGTDDRFPAGHPAYKGEPKNAKG